ncbi:MAG: TonB-dependent receptor [Flavobacteriales bacterium]|nr:TonB-dependent receptor [Flavobacteriales bacterium]
MLQPHRIIVLLCLMLGTALLSRSQNLTQTIRGTVIDKDTRMPLMGASVLVRSMEPQIGTITDENGSFRFDGLPIGRHTLLVEFIGYNEALLSNLELTSTRELTLQVLLEEKVLQMNTAVVVGRKDKTSTINSSISVSGRTFSIEESQRYAGSRGDVARMAQNFAGVQGSDDSRNDIVVRGNSPTGVLYRLEGVDIPNPNHFASAGTTGGPVSMLNNNVLENSDFISGAFPAEYGNGVAAVFDLGLRKGNNETHEFLGQIGFAGFEAMAEGPINKKKQSSYLVNARYSTLKAFSIMGLDFGTGTAVPDYYDLTFNLNFPDKKGAWSMFGIGGNSNIAFIQSSGDSENLYSDQGEDLTYGTATGFVAIQRFQRLSKNSFLKLMLATDAGQVRTVVDTFVMNDQEIAIDQGPRYRNRSYDGKNAFVVNYQNKLNAANTIKAGTRVYRHFFNLTDSAFSGSYNRWVRLTDYRGSTYSMQVFGQWQHKFSERLSMNTGMNTLLFTLNNSFSVEPRFGLVYKVMKETSVNIGYGLHSQIPAFRIYFFEPEDEAGNRRSINQDVKPYKSHHFVLGVNQRTGEHSRVKVEAYYQHLFDVPVDAGSETYYSYLNQGADFGIEFTENLVNSGTGRNYGIELTAERFLHKGFYYLNTLSLYRAFYTDINGNEHPTAFDNRYALNLLAGKEFWLKKDTKAKQKSFTADLRYMLNGGRRYTPVNEELSREKQEEILDWSQIFSKTRDPYYRFDLRIAFKVQSKKVTQEWGVDIQNLTNHQNLFRTVYNPRTNEYSEIYQTGLLPIMLYRITF